MSNLLQKQGVKHEVLNAKQHEREAQIIVNAGRPGAVTIATNMAGRGTDIKLGEGVKELGGLHVICTEMHDSARIDRQLIGRCGRQGDPGTFRQYLALDDELLLAGLGPKKGHKLEDIGKDTEDGYDPMERLFKKAQHKVELTESLYVARTEVTQGQWVEVMGTNPSFHDTGGRYPAESVTWFEAVEFCNRLSEREATMKLLEQERAWRVRNGDELKTFLRRVFTYTT